eukprot:UN00790
MCLRFCLTENDFQALTTRKKTFSSLPHGERFLLICHVENGF